MGKFKLDVSGELTMGQGQSKVFDPRAPKPMSLTCTNPIEVRRGRNEEKEGYNETLLPGQLRPCLKCEGCANRKIVDWTGKALAELAAMEREGPGLAVAITLTYRDNHGCVNPNAHKVLTYHEPQLFLKRLRAKGYAVRYIIAGEYGDASLTKRAHWHAILYFRGNKFPEFKYEEDYFTWDAWPHGFVYVTKPNRTRFMYVCKYAVKDFKDPTSQRHFRMSKRPLIGAGYFKSLAWTVASLGLTFDSPEYAFHAEEDERIKPFHVPAGHPLEGKAYERKEPFNYRVEGAARNLVQSEYLAAWALLHPDRDRPPSEWIERGVERMEREAERALDLGPEGVERFQRKLEARKRVWRGLAEVQGQIVEVELSDAELLPDRPYKPEGRRSDHKGGRPNPVPLPKRLTLWQVAALAAKRRGHVRPLSEQGGGFPVRLVDFINGPISPDPASRDRRGTEGRKVLGPAPPVDPALTPAERFANEVARVFGPGSGEGEA